MERKHSIAERHFTLFHYNPVEKIGHNHFSCKQIGQKWLLQLAWSVRRYGDKEEKIKSNSHICRRGDWEKRETMKYNYKADQTDGFIVSSKSAQERQETLT